MPASPFLRTRVARRILLLFLLCAVLPLALLATIGYNHLANDLDRLTRAHLRDQAKSSGMMLLDRLGSLATQLEAVSTQLDGGPLPRSPAMVSSAASSGPRFRAMGIVATDGSVTNLAGELPGLPALNQDQEDHVRGGGIALVTGPGLHGIRLFLVRRIDRLPGARLWGFIERASVYGTDPSTSVAPAGSLSCLRTERNEELSCLAPEAGLSADGALTWRWQRGNDGYLAAQWTLFLHRVYAAPSWVISISVSDTVVSAPLTALRRVFLLGLALSLLVTFTLAHIQLRRSMEPLEALEAGTLRVAAGQFHHPVAVQSGDEFQALAASFNRMSSRLGHQFEYQAALARVHEAALTAGGPEVVLRAILSEQRALLAGDAVTVALASPDDPDHWNVVADRGAPDGPVLLKLRPDSQDLKHLRDEREGFLLPRGGPAPSYLGRGSVALGADALVLPLRWRGSLTGALILEGSRARPGTGDGFRDARRAADEVALAISNAQLVTQLDEMNWGALTALARAIDAVSPWTAGHSERVTLGAIEIGRRLDFAEDEIDLLHRGGLLHDVGKVGVPAGVLDKPGPLTPEEFVQIRRHPTIGARILAPITAFRRAIPLVLHHHELLDGSGYPHGLIGDQIPLSVRVLTVADVYDALVSKRPYREAWEVDRAVDYLRQHVGSKFDGRAVEALVAALDTGWRPTVSPQNVYTDEPARLSLWPSRVSDPGFRLEAHHEVFRSA